MLFYDRTGLFFSEKKAIVLNIGSNIYRLWTKNKINELLAVFLHLRGKRKLLRENMAEKNMVEQR
jgi:hypothetical protein